MSVTRASLDAAYERHDALAQQARHARTAEQRIASLEKTVADLFDIVHDQRGEIGALIGVVKMQGAELAALRRYAPVAEVQ